MSSRLTAVSPPLHEIAWSEPVSVSFVSEYGYGQQERGMYALKDILVETGWTVERSSTGLATDDSDLWIEPASISTYAWALLREPSAGRQVLIWTEDDIWHAFVAWSPGAEYEGGTILDRPTADDEQPVMAALEVGLLNGGGVTHAFTAIAGTRGAERYTRILATLSNSTVWFYLAFDRVCTDLTAEELPDNQCTVYQQGAVMARPNASNGPFFCCTMADGSHPRLYDLNSAWTGFAPTAKDGVLDEKQRASPVFVCHSNAEAQLIVGDLEAQVVGYIPDLHWTSIPASYYAFYDAQTTWTQVHEILIPAIGDVPHLSDGGAIEVRALTPMAPGGAQPVDEVAPSVTLESPSESVKIQPTTTLVLRVNDTVSLRAINIFIDYPDAPTIPCEVVYYSRGFEPNRYGSSSRTELGEDSDYRYYISRTGGWPSNPRVLVDPIDGGGNAIE